MRSGETCLSFVCFLYDLDYDFEIIYCCLGVSLLLYSIRTLFYLFETKKCHDLLQKMYYGWQISTISSRQ